MPTIAEQLTQLESDRQDLVSNLQTKGITGLTGDETFTALVPEVLNISSGGGEDNFEDLIDGTLTSINNSNITSVRNEACRGLTTLTNVSLPNATSIGNNAFNGCTSLSNINMSSATSIGTSAFYNCSSLQSASSNYATTIGGSAFRGCTNLTSINFPSVTSIGTNCFYGSGITSITDTMLPELSIIEEYTFFNCTSLTSVQFNKVESINQHCFQGCTSLTTAKFNKLGSMLNYAFMGCTSLTSITLGGNWVCSLQNTQAIPTGQNITIYVPSNQITNYQTATNWSTLYNNGYVTFVAIS